MVTLKISLNGGFKYTHYVEADDSRIKRYIGPISPMHDVAFKVVDPIDPQIQQYLEKRQDEYVLKINNSIYFIEGGVIVVMNPFNRVFLKRNITQFRIGKNQFNPIEDIKYYLLCYFNFEKEIFFPIGTEYITLTTTEEISQLQLIKTSLETGVAF